MTPAPPHGPFALTRRTLSLVFTPQGRSRRTEVAIWWLLCSFAPTAFVSSAGYALPFLPALILSEILIAFMLVALFSLFIRRLHDHDLSGWWVLPLPVYLLCSLPNHIHWIMQRLEPKPFIPAPDLPLWVDVLGIGAFIIMVALMLGTGTTGPNRFGPDPRDPQKPVERYSG